LGTAQKYLTDVTAVTKKLSPVRQNIKRPSQGAGGAESSKEMNLKLGSLADIKQLKLDTTSSPAEPKNTDSARAQMEAFVEQYQRKIKIAKNKALGLRANTLGAPTLEAPTLTRNTLAKKTFAEGGEAKKFEDDEVSQEELDAASRPAFVTPKSGKGRREGEISKQLKSGDAYANMAKGVTELPYDLVGSGVDLATMAMRPFGYSTEKPVMGSDFIKEKMTKLGVRPEPPTDPTAKGFYTAGELLSNLVNPAGAVRTGVKGAEKVGQAATDVGKDFLEYNRQISVPGASYAVPPQGPAKTPAPASGLGFYSAAEQAALNLPRKEGSGAAFLNDLMKAPDVKKEELASMGLDEFLRGKPKATRQEVQDFIANNRIDVKEVQLGEKVVEDPAGLAKRKEIFDKYEPEILALYKQMEAEPGGYSREREQRLMDKALEIQFRRDREADAAYTVPEPLPPKFGQFQLPGGKNYREILLTTPGKKPPPVTSADDPRVKIEGSETRGWEVLLDGKTVQSYRPGVKESSVRDYALADANSAIENRAARNQYKSSHFDEPNILAHLRVNDRVDADGKKMLLIEELQSDWHQAGREKGYNTPQKRAEEQKKLDALLAQRQQLLERRTQLEELASPYTSQNKDAPRDVVDEWNNVSNQLNRLQTEQNRLGRDFGNTGVPDAPFKDTWHQLALKRALKYAADNGYERVGLTTGKQQSQRYNLGTQVDHISYEPTEKGFYINVISKDGPNVLNGDYSAKELEGIVGKELTQKMLAKEGKNEFNPEIEPDLAEIRRLDGVDLQLEDKGMKKYYDEIYPAFLAKQAKKYGAQVGETSIKTQTSAPAYVDYIVGRGNFTDTTVLGVRADGSTEIINQNPNSLQEAQQLANRYKEKHLGGGKEAVRYIDIAPGMKDAVPYAKGGMVDKNTAFIQAHS
jgi:hypothetical protein